MEELKNLLEFGIQLNKEYQFKFYEKEKLLMLSTYLNTNKFIDTLIELSIMKGLNLPKELSTYNTKSFDEKGKVNQQIMLGICMENENK